MIMTLKQCINLFISHHLFVIKNDLLLICYVKNIQQESSKGLPKSATFTNFIEICYESVQSVLSCSFANKEPYMF